VTAFVYESQRYVTEKIQVLGVSVEPPDAGRKLRERTSRDCQEDRPHVLLDPYPVRLLSDPQGNLIRAVGAGREGHWSGFISHPTTLVIDPQARIRWTYATEDPSDRPSPLAVIKAAVDIAKNPMTLLG
jgi:peroxiredoxin